MRKGRNSGRTKGARRITALLAVLLSCVMCAVPAAAAEGGQADTAPEHHKYIKYNGGESYTLTLDVKGIYDEEKVKPQVDVVLIVDKSTSMSTAWSHKKNRMDVLKEVITKENGLSQAILDNPQIDARMAVVSYSGNKGNWSDKWGWDNKDTAWNDSQTECGWTDNVQTIRQAVNALSPERAGGTNCQAGLREAGEMLADSRTGARKYVLFLSDGAPTFYYDEDGITEGNGQNDRDGYCAGHAYTQAELLTQLQGFYTIGISNDSVPDFMKELETKPQASQHGSYIAGESDELAQIFETIIGDITRYTCRNVVITDMLSEYAELENAAEFTASIDVRDAQGNKVELLSMPDGTNVSAEQVISVACDETGKEVTARFADGYILNENYTYLISFNIKPSQYAYETYIENGGNYGGNTGSAGSDAPGNSTSSGKDGFSSNASAKLSYIYGKENASETTVDYLESPVIQVNVDAPALDISKRVGGELGDKSRAYRIFLELKDSKGNPVSGDYAYTGGVLEGAGNVTAPPSGTVTFVNGRAEIRLAHGQKVSIENLPLNGSYTVWEENISAEGYKVTYNGEKSENAQGSLRQDAAVEIVNEKEMVPPTGIRGGTTGNKGAWTFLFLTVSAVWLIAVAGKRIRRNKP